MGYRSDVSVVFYTRNHETVPLAALYLWFDENYPAKTADEEWQAKITKGSDYVIIEYHGVKWYSEYEHVKEVKAALDKFTDTFAANGDTEADVAWEMMEVGEDMTDITRDGSSWNDWRLDVARTIHFN